MQIMFKLRSMCSEYFFLSQVEEVLRVLHCVEVFLEIAALRLGGPAARWALIFSLQVGLGMYSVH